MRRHRLLLWSVVVGALILSGGCGMAGKRPLKLQSTCPVGAGKITRALYADAAGARIYVCSIGCLAKVKAAPRAYIRKMVNAGERPETRLVVCPLCGEIKGSAKCCVQGAAKCPKCGLNKGSIGCCRQLRPAPGEKDVVLCPKCGQVKGSATCCVAGAIRCPKCGLAKGSPGCCKLKMDCRCGTYGTAAVCGCSK